MEQILEKITGDYAVFRRDMPKPMEVINGNDLVVLVTAFYEDKRHYYTKVDSSFARKFRRSRITE